ncbi:DNA cytosine methyltransferase [Janibacter anophelis]|uniref:DNA cytosine methyltransferase n=1 Tax=Janibacter anophelis TaxID=319054 RepID=UPI003F7EE481
MIPVVDLFAGPGGLNEGFTSIEDGGTFQTAASFEMDPVACRTLRLRSALRTVRLAEGAFPDAYADFMDGRISFDSLIEHGSMKAAWKDAGEEVHNVELGPESHEVTEQAIERRLRTFARRDDFVLLGGPPCQAYSLAGRSRRRNSADFEEDVKHFLFREYLHIIRQFQPAAFVMENVKGLLSSTHSRSQTSGHRMFDLILSDMVEAGYEVRSLVVGGPQSQLRPSDYVIRSEQYGVPQKRHRVILFGVRGDRQVVPSGVIQPSEAPTVRHMIEGFPALRSRLRPLGQDGPGEWGKNRNQGASLAGGSALGPVPDDWGSAQGAGTVKDSGADLPARAWVRAAGPRQVVQHEARGHMASDIQRYAYASKYALQHGVSPKLRHYPEPLLPNHKNARDKNVPFADRFRVQTWEEPSTTVVSHISKDGHYYIHPDPRQARSLTVREAARLQTFPDNYVFAGNRTEQYHQVGNAVPPFLARQIGQVVGAFFNAVGS